MTSARTAIRSALLAVVLVTFATISTARAQAAPPIGAYTTKGAWSFSSAPGLHPPKLLTQGRVASEQLASGDFLLANFPYLADTGPMTGQGGPLIVDNRLRPVWFQPVGTSVVSGDLQQETLDGRPVLVWWEGVVTRTGATQSGEVEVVDERYRKLATVRAQGPAGCTGAGCWKISIHDAVISGSDIWVTVYRTVSRQNLVRYGGSARGAVYDAGLQEFSLANPSKPTLVQTWDALNPGGRSNVPLSESEQPASHGGDTGLGGSWDAYHINAVQALPNDRVLVTMRNTWAVYLLDASSGAVVWKLGGKASSFRLPVAASFEWPHDAQMLANGDVSLFDDNCCKFESSGQFAKPNGFARGLVLKLDQTSRSASVAASYLHAPRLVVSFLGSMQLLAGSRALVGWGNQPFFSEYSQTGRQLLDVQFPHKDLSYRALLSSSWVGAPYYPPLGAARTGHTSTTVYASWNGATQVATWVVLAGTTSAKLSEVAAARPNGFETAIELRKRTPYRFFQVRALDANHRPLATSKTFIAR